MKWINVKEKLPDDYDFVLISYVANENPNLRYVPSVGERINGFWTTKESSAESAAVHRDFEKAYNVTVTHWMELPKAPTSK